MGDSIRILLTNAGAAGMIALLAWAASRVVRRQAVVHGLWLLALVKLVAPPIAPLPLLPGWIDLRLERPSATEETVPAPRSTEASTPLTPAVVEPAHPEASLDIQRATVETRSHTTGSSLAPAPGLDWRAVAWTLVVAGALGVAALATWRFVRFGRLLRCARPATPLVAGRCSTLAARMGLRRTPPVLVVPARIPPMLWPERGGPQLLLPQRLIAELRADELDALLAHELAHVRRRDHWVRLLEIAATALFWWYPVTWWARRELRRAEERCCDEWVLRLLPLSAEAYANGLLKSLAFVAESSVPALASGLGPTNDIETRLKEILMTRPAPRLVVPLRLALASAAALALAVFPTRAHTGAAMDDPAAPTTAGTSATAETPVPPAKPASAAKPAPAPARARATTPAPPPAPAPEPAIAPTTGRPDAERRAFEDQRRAIDEQRRQLHRQALQLAQKQAELESKVKEAELRTMVDRLRAEGKPELAAQFEGQIQLNAERLQLQKRQQQLEVEREALEARLEAEGHADHDRPRASEERARDEAATDARRELKEAERARMLAEEELRQKQHAIQVKMVEAEKRLEAAAAEGQATAVHNATEELARALARQIEAFERTAAQSPAQKKDLDRELQRLKAALDALRR
jgi:beta-lactamase regulating signal transducer with metallopeptidase domain